MYDIARMPAAIDIGLTGERAFRTIEINMAAWMQETPDGIPSIVHIRPGEGQEDAYIADTTFANNILTWEISAGDLGTREGYGVAQVWLEEEENSSVVKRGKSVIIATLIGEAISEADPTPPAPQTGWLEQMTALKVATVNAASDANDAKTDAVAAKGAAQTAQGKAEDAQAAAEYAQGKAEDAQEAAEAAQSAAETAAGHYPCIDDDTGKWLVWDADSGAYVSTGINAQGPQGETGQTGQTGQTGPAGTSAYLHIRYAAAEPTSDSDMKTTPDKWIGVYSGTASTAPSTYTSYTWYQYKGDKGDTGNTGATGAVPAIAIGTVTTVSPSDPATVTRRSGTPDTAPVFDFEIPKGETGQAGNVYGNTVDMSSTDNTKVATAIGNKADKAGTVLTTTLSRGRKANTTVGTGSFAFGNDVEASGDYSLAEGSGTKASGTKSHAEGSGSVASGVGSHAEGISLASGDYSHSENDSTNATGEASHAEGCDNLASGKYSHAEGYHVTANHRSQHVGGEYNINDTSNNAATDRGTYVEIIGNGTSSSSSNARALDWDGNEYLKGDVYVNCSNTSSNGVALGASLMADMGIVENTDTATHNISAGQYVIWKGSLRTASQAISTGGTLSSSNLTAVSGGGFNSLNSNLSTLSSVVDTKANGNLYTYRTGNTGGKTKVLITTTSSAEAIFLIASYVSNGYQAKLSIISKTSSNVFEAKVYGNGYTPTIANNVITLSNATYSHYIILGTVPFTVSTAD